MKRLPRPTPRIPDCPQVARCTAIVRQSIVWLTAAQRMVEPSAKSGMGAPEVYAHDDGSEEVPTGNEVPCGHP